jgi:hypothetical protein
MAKNIIRFIIYCIILSFSVSLVFSQSTGDVVGTRLCMGADCRSTWPTFSESDNLQAVTDRGRTTTQNIQSPRYEDYNSPSYYVDPAGTSNLNVLNKLRFSGVGGDSGQSPEYYAIYQESGAWTNPYPDLRIQYHTGIEMEAYFGYGGIRMYDGYDGSGNPNDLAFAVGNGDHTVRSYHNFYAPIMFDQNNPSYYVDPASTSRMNAITYDTLSSSSSSSYGITTQNIYMDTVNTGVGGDPLEINYYRQGDVRICNGPAGICSVGIGTNPSYRLDVNGDIRAQSAWLRTTGNTGWYSDTWGGGWFMQDGTWIRAYNSKSVYTPGEMQAGTVRGNSNLCIGSDCRSSWPSFAGDPTPDTIADDNVISSGEVNFNYAGSNSKGGGATSCNGDSTCEIQNYIEGAYGTVAQSTDEWLRLNPAGGSDHSSGIYSAGGLRADGGLAAGGYSLSGGEVRASLFRDGNSGYYVDPASTSVLSTVCVSGTCGASLTSDGTYIVANNYLRAPSGVYSQGWLQSNGHLYGAWSGGGNRLYLSGYTNNGLYNDGTWIKADTYLRAGVGIYSDNYIQGAGYIQSPIFYDWDSSYYLNADSTSRLNSLITVGSITLGGVARSSWPDAIPSGLIAMFAGSCPSGWSEFTSMRNRFPRGDSNGVYTGSTGGSDTHSHTYNDVISHSHSASSGNNNADHTHGGTTSTTGSHAHSTPVFTRAGGDEGGRLTEGDDQGAGSKVLMDAAGNHAHTFSSGGTSASHQHSVTVNAAGVGTGTTNSPSALPQYLDVIYCQKS